MSSGIAKWRAGLKFVDSREFTRQEKKEINALILRKALFSLLCLVSIVLLFGLSAFSAAIMDILGHDSMHMFSSVMAFVIPIYIAGAMICSAFNLIRVMTLFRDLRKNRMESYAGQFDENAIKPRSMNALIRNSLFLPVSERPQTMDALAGSGLIWSVNGIRQRYWLTVPMMETAEEPSYAAIAAEWVVPLDPTRTDLAYVNQRQMTSDEKSELVHYIRVSLKKNLFMTLFMNTWFVYSVDQVLTQHQGLDLFFALSLFVASTWDISLFTRLVRIAKFNGDLKMGILVIARMPDKIEKMPESQVPSLSNRTEFLPISRYLWSREGIPATWRTTPLQ